MTNITIKINGATAHKLGQQGALTTGMVGATVAFEFSPEWEGLIKTAVFRGGGVTRDLVGIGDTVPIPPEVLQAEGYLAVGVEGYDAEHTLVIPTTWENAAAYIHAGANASGDPAADPTLPIWAQLQAMIGDLSDLDTEAKANLVAAVNELAAKSGGTVDDEAEGGWELVDDLTVKEAVKSVHWGNLHYRELKIYAYNPEGSGSAAYAAPRVNGIPLGSVADMYAYSGAFFNKSSVKAEISVFAFGDFAMLALNGSRVYSKEAIGKYDKISSFTWESFGAPENDAAIRANGRYIVYGRK